ncbi:MAG: SDR family NAD(P)-dependent oxidoreductase [bacterium]|nr:hypothetical protein [Deltaproteobacteria bacterium]MCP4907972.1 SDR family NAD(P)-dependent oxidoreductase [bacterium]
MSPGSAALQMKDKVVAITGAGRGIGRAIAIAMAAEGASVIVNDLGSDDHGRGSNPSPADEVVKEIRAAGGSAVANHRDVADFDEAAEIIGSAVEHFGRLDVLVNNAAVHFHATVEDHSSEDWDRVLAVNAKGAFNCAHHALPVMREGGWGSIINMVSGAFWEGTAHLASYGASKGASMGLMLTLDTEFREHNINSNCISPSVTHTRLVDRWLADLSESSETTEEDVKQQWGVQTPENLAPLAIYLASDRGHAISGQIFEVQDDQIIAVSPPTRGNRIQRSGEHWELETLASAIPGISGHTP